MVHRCGYIQVPQPILGVEPSLDMGSGYGGSSSETGTAPRQMRYSVDNSGKYLEETANNNCQRTVPNKCKGWGGNNRCSEVESEGQAVLGKGMFPEGVEPVEDHEGREEKN